MNVPDVTASCINTVFCLHLKKDRRWTQACKSVYDGNRKGVKTGCNRRVIGDYYCKVKQRSVQVSMRVSQNSIVSLLPQVNSKRELIWITLIAGHNTLPHHDQCHWLWSWIQKTFKKRNCNLKEFQPYLGQRRLYLGRPLNQRKM